MFFSEWFERTHQSFSWLCAIVGFVWPGLSVVVCGGGGGVLLRVQLLTPVGLVFLQVLQVLGLCATTRNPNRQARGCLPFFSVQFCAKSHSTGSKAPNVQASGTLHSLWHGGC
jgi:hypothetical protein